MHCIGADSLDESVAFEPPTNVAVFGVPDPPPPPPSRLLLSFDMDRLVPVGERDDDDGDPLPPPPLRPPICCRLIVTGEVGLRFCCWHIGLNLAPGSGLMVIIEAQQSTCDNLRFRVGDTTELAVAA